MSHRSIVLSLLMRVGDNVTVVFDKKDEGFSYKAKELLALEGKEGKVFAFQTYTTYEPNWRYGAKHPGVYEALGLPLVRFEDGTGMYISPHDLMWSSFHEKRSEDRQKARAHYFELDSTRNERLDGMVRTGDLPKLPFYELDKVRIDIPNHSWDGLEVIVSSIEWSQLNKKRNDGSPMPIFTVKFPEGGQTTLSYSQLVLIERGLLYKHLNGEELSFTSLQEEIEFAHGLCKVQELRNPKSGVFSWTKDEILEALKANQAHGMQGFHGLFGSGFSVQAVHFDDPELGERVRLFTLKGWEK